jgi:hypothetical protein
MVIGEVREDCEFGTDAAVLLGVGIAQGTFVGVVAFDVVLELRD